MISLGQYSSGLIGYLVLELKTSLYKYSWFRNKYGFLAIGFTVLTLLEALWSVEKSPPAMGKGISPSNLLYIFH